MARVIATINQKGGVAKSASSINISYCLANNLGKKTLLCDLDSQNNSGKVYAKNQEFTVNNLFLDHNFATKKAIFPSQLDDKQVKNLDVINSSIHLAKISEQIASKIHREKILIKHLNRIKQDYDYIILDCPSNLGVITVNAIYAADLLLIPINYDTKAIEGFTDLINTIEEVKECPISDCPHLIIRTMYDARNSQTNELVESALQDYPNIATVRIRRNEAINQSRMVDEPIFTYDKKSHGADDYKALTEEIITYG